MIIITKEAIFDLLHSKESAYRHYYVDYNIKIGDTTDIIRKDEDKDDNVVEITIKKQDVINLILYRVLDIDGTIMTIEV